MPFVDENLSTATQLRSPIKREEEKLRNDVLSTTREAE